MESIVNLVEIIIWPTVVLFIFCNLKKPIINILNKSNEISLKLMNGTELNLAAKEAEPLLKELIEDTELLLASINNDEIELFTKIYNQSIKRKVEFYFPNFERGNENHKLLSSLRERRMIEPLEGGSWQATKHPKITTFGLFIAKYQPHKVLIENEC